MTATRFETISNATLNVYPPNDHEYRLLYASNVPVDEWSVSYGTFEELAEKARSRAKLDLRPSSMVFDNVFIISRWDGESWDDYDNDGNDLTDLAFDDGEDNDDDDSF